MIATEIEVRASRREDDEERDALVRSLPRSSFFHLSGWRRSVEEVFRHEPQDLVALRGDAIVGVLPLMRCPGLPRGSNLLSMPYAVYGGPVGEDRAVEQALLARAVALADESRVGHLELRYQHDPGPELVGTDLYWTFVRDLPEKADDVLKRMPKKARAEARKARDRNGLELSEGVWYVEDLYRLFLKNKHSLGSPGMPPTFFRRLLEEFEGNIHVHLVRKDRTPLAAVMSFAFEGTLTAYYSGTEMGADREYSASNFMYMALQEWAVRNGFRTFDFGRSRQDAGAFRFKQHQGFEPEPLHYRYHLVRDRGVPSFNPSNPKTAVLRESWSRMPAWMVRRLSNRLARYLP